MLKSKFYSNKSPKVLKIFFSKYHIIYMKYFFAQKHREFYESLFALMQTPRSLQHLARHRLRSFLEGRLHNVVPKLGLPTFLQNYLMLAFRDYMHWQIPQTLYGILYKHAGIEFRLILCDSEWFVLKTILSLPKMIQSGGDFIGNGGKAYNANLWVRFFM